MIVSVFIRRPSAFLITPGSSRAIRPRSASSKSVRSVRSAGINGSNQPTARTGVPTLIVGRPRHHFTPMRVRSPATVARREPFMVRFCWPAMIVPWCCRLG